MPIIMPEQISMIDMHAQTDTFLLHRLPLHRPTSWP